MARTLMPQLALEPPCLVQGRKEMRRKAVRERIDVSTKKAVCRRYVLRLRWLRWEHLVKAEGWGSSILGKEAS